MKYVYFFPFLLIISCGNPSKTEIESVVFEKKDSSNVVSEKKVSGDFSSIVKEISISTINQYIHPEKGMWIINSSGAMPSMSHTTQVDKNFPVDFFGIKNEDVPSVNCDAKNFWTKDGCFLQEADLLSDTQIWEHSSLSKEDKDKVVALVQTVKWTAINTSFHARYYFSQIEGKWYLTFVDLRTPCSA